MTDDPAFAEPLPATEIEEVYAVAFDAASDSDGSKDERAEIAELDREIAVYADMVAEMRARRRLLKGRLRKRKGGKV